MSGASKDPPASYALSPTRAPAALLSPSIAPPISLRLLHLWNRSKRPVLWPVSQRPLSLSLSLRKHTEGLSARVLCKLAKLTVADSRGFVPESMCRTLKLGMCVCVCVYTRTHVSLSRTLILGMCVCVSVCVHTHTRVSESDTYIGPNNVSPPFRKDNGNSSR